VARAEAIRIRGVPWPGVSPDTTLHELGWPSDDYSTSSTSTAALLRSFSRIGEDEVKLHEVLDIAFDEDIREDTFLPPSGVGGPTGWSFATPGTELESNHSGTLVAHRDNRLCNPYATPTCTEMGGKPG
jgi:hypothetical protein